jgi:hypothetical protein
MPRHISRTVFIGRAEGTPENCVEAQDPKYPTLQNPELHISSLSMIRSLQVLFDSNLRQAHVAFNRIVLEMPNLREFCVGFRSPLDFFQHSGAPKRWWLKRICRVRALDKFDLRFEEESFRSGMERLHYREHGLGPQFDACMRVLKQICESTATKGNAVSEGRYISDPHGDRRYLSSLSRF